MKGFKIDIALIATLILFIIFAVLVSYSKTNVDEIPYGKTSELYSALGFVALILYALYDV